MSLGLYFKLRVLGQASGIGSQALYRHSCEGFRYEIKDIP